MMFEQLNESRMSIMGILNVTPDSFYDGGKYNHVDAAIDHARQIIDAGADIIDIGGESTRPGSLPVDAEKELERVVPVIRAIRKFSDIPISIDTTKAFVAREAIEAGASIVNDITACLSDQDMIAVVKQLDVPVIMMHMQGTPETMQECPVYNGWVVDEICSFFEERIAYAEAHGVSKDRIILDPGIGFGKTLDHNLDIIANCGRLRKFGVPILMAHSNKRFIGELLSLQSVDERIWGTAAVAAFTYLCGNADMIRVHNVSEIKMILTMLQVLQSRIQ